MKVEKLESIMWRLVVFSLFLVKYAHFLTLGLAARELGISVNTLHGWVKKYKPEPKVIEQRTFRSEEQKTNEMERRIRDLEEENAILKKAMHFFAKDHR